MTKMEMSIDSWTNSSIHKMKDWVRFDHDCLRPEHCLECDKNQEKNRKFIFTSGGNVIINTKSILLNSSSFKIVINVPLFDLSIENVKIICQDTRLSETNLKALMNSGWYWPDINSEASNKILSGTKPGTFLVRPSSDQNYLFTLSVQTEIGPTSVRLHYKNGKFSFDSEKTLSELLPKFPTVISLVEHYVEGKAVHSERQVWMDPSGKMHSKVRLTKPMKREVGSLQHLSRLAINRNKLNADLVPTSIQHYLSEYTYSL